MSLWAAYVSTNDCEDATKCEQDEAQLEPSEHECADSSRVREGKDPDLKPLMRLSSPLAHPLAGR